MTANPKIDNIQVIHAAFEDEPVYIANYFPGYEPTDTYKKYLSDENCRSRSCTRRCMESYTKH